jgi:hypothetical protein
VQQRACTKGTNRGTKEVNSTINEVTNEVNSTINEVTNEVNSAMSGQLWMGWTQMCATGRPLPPL